MKFTGTVPEDVAQMRLETIMEIQREISAGKNRLLLNLTLPVIVDGFTEEGRLYGRTRWQAPDIDGQYLITSGHADIGEYVPLKITDSSEYDLIGEIVED